MERHIEHGGKTVEVKVSKIFLLGETFENLLSIERGGKTVEVKADRKSVV